MLAAGQRQSKPHLPQRRAVNFFGSSRHNLYTPLAEVKFKYTTNVAISADCVIKYVLHSGLCAAIACAIAWQQLLLGCYAYMVILHPLRQHTLLHNL